MIPAFISRKIPYMLGRKSKSSKTITLNKYQSCFIARIQVFLRIIVLVEKKLRLKLGLSLISASVKK
jgi:hypothetical protein